MSCICFICLLCIYYFVPPPLISGTPIVVADYTAAEYDYVVDDRTPTVELPGKQSHSPSPDIAYLFRTFLVLGIIAAAMLHSYSNAKHVIVALVVSSFILCCLLNIYTI